MTVVASVSVKCMILPYSNVNRSSKVSKTIEEICVKGIKNICRRPLGVRTGGQGVPPPLLDPLVVWIIYDHQCPRLLSERSMCILKSTVMSKHSCCLVCLVIAGLLKSKDINNAPVNILPARGGGGHTRGFRQKTIPDRREFDKLMESGSRVI